MKSQMNVMTQQVQEKKKQAVVYGGDIVNLDSDSLTLAKQFDRNLERNGEEGIYYYNKEGQVTFNSYKKIKENALKLLQGLYENHIRPKEMVIFQ